MADVATRIYLEMSSGIAGNLYYRTLPIPTCTTELCLGDTGKCSDYNWVQKMHGRIAHRNRHIVNMLEGR